MNVQEIISSGVLELYCLGLTSEAETAEVAAWANQYPEVKAEIEAIQSGLESYARANAVAPAASVKGKIFDAIKETSATPVVDLKPVEGSSAKVYAISPAWKYVAAASVILLAGSLIMNYTFYNKYQSANTELVSTRNKLQEEIANVKSMDTVINVISDIQATPIAVKSMEPGSGMDARIYWMKNTNEVYIDPANLPKAPAGKQYEFWAIIDGAPVNGGVITTEINGKKVHVQKMKSFGKVQAFAISLEDAGPAKTKPDKVMAVGSI